MKIGGKNVSNTLYIGGQRPFTSADKSNLDKNTSARHTHSNKSVLDGITEEKVSQWDAGGGSGKEDKSNKVQSLSDTSTGEQYPSAKATVDYVKQMVGNKDKFEIGITLEVNNKGIYSTSNPTHTYEDIKQAYDDGKDVYLLTGGLAGNNRMPIVAVNDMSIEFGLTMGNNYVTISCNSVNTWITTTHTFASEDEVADIRVRKDGTVCVRAGDAVRKLEVEINGYYEVGKNKCNPDAFSERYSTINSDGKIVSSSAATFVTGYIPVVGESHVIVSYTNGQGQTSKTTMKEIVFYEENGGVLSRIENVSEADIPASATGLRVIVPQQYWDAKQRVMVEFGTELTAYETYRVVTYDGLKQTKVDKDGENQVTIKNAEFIETYVSPNMYNKYTRTDGYTMQTDGTLTENTSRAASDYIPCYGKTVFSVSDGTQGVFCFYDGNKNFLSPYGVYSSTGTTNVAIPENAYYLRTSLLKATAETFMLVFSESVGEFEEYGTRYILRDEVEVPKAASVDVVGNDPKRIISEVLKTGGQIKFIGDSITAGVGGTGFVEDGDIIVNSNKVNTNGYCMANLFKTYIESKYGNTVLNYGVRGSRSYNLKTWILGGSLVSDDDKLLIVMTGTNNKWATENSTLKDLKADLEWFINWCKNNNKKLILISAPVSSVQQDTTYSDGSAVKFHNEDIDHIYKEVCYENNCDYIPMYQKMLEYCDFTNASIDEILSDGLHPNDKGYYIMYKILMRSLGLAYQLPGSDWDNATPN